MPAASSEADFKAAYAAADAANKEAGTLRNQWTVTAAALADAILFQLHAAAVGFRVGAYGDVDERSTRLARQRSRRVVCCGKRFCHRSAACRQGEVRAE